MRTARRQVPMQLGSVAWRYWYPHGRHILAARWHHRISGSCEGKQPKKPEHLGALHRDERLQRIEAVLFVAREPLSSRKLSDYANLADGTEARTLIRRLNTLYDESGRAFRVEEVAGGFQLLSRPKFASWLRRLSHVPPETRLSTPVLETLAVIAYRQPVLRADIEAIRGVNCGEILRQLMERDLVRISGRSHELGRPYLYSTTKRFLQLFGLSHIEKLPRVQGMRSIFDDVDCPQDQANSMTLLTQKEESEVTVTTRELPEEELLGDPALVPTIALAAQARDDDEDIEEDFDEEEEEFDDDEDDDEDEDIDDEEFDEEEFDDEFEDEEDDEFDDEDDDEFEDEEWEEVEDEEEEEEEEDEDWDDEELDWEDDDDADEEDEDEEEEEEEEDWE